MPDELFDSPLQSRCHALLNYSNFLLSSNLKFIRNFDCPLIALPVKWWANTTFNAAGMPAFFEI